MKKLARNSPCPCGSGKKYKHCCIHKDFDWVEMDDGQVAKSVEVSRETRAALEHLRQSQVRAFGREPERIFEGAPPLEVIEHLTVEAMKKAGVEPALIYAFEETGLMVNEENERRVTDADLAEWEDAINDYEHKTGKKAARRRLNRRDLRGILANGPNV